MNNLKIFSNSEFGQIRTVEIDNKTYFVAADVAKALGYKKPNNAINDHCRWAVKWGIPHPQSKNKTLEVNVIPEGDLYRLIANSELPSAQRFESWIFDEVLPSIRKTGAYTINPTYAYPVSPAAGAAAAELGRVTERIMRAQGSSPYKIAAVFKLECEQLGIELPADFVEIPLYEQLTLEEMITG